MKIQKEIYSASLDEKLEPICPSVVHTELIVNSRILKFLVKMESKYHKDKRQELHDMLFASRGLIEECGLIVMEYLEGFEPLFNLLNKPTITPEMSKHYYYCVCYEMIRMYNLTGYLHGDFHQYNFMVNPTYSYFGDDAEFSGRAIIIDFGSSFKPPLKSKIALNYKNKKTGAISILKLNLEHKTPAIKGFFVVGDWPSYQWLEPFFINNKVAAETEKKLIQYDAMRNRFIEFWMQTIGGGVEEPVVSMDVPVVVRRSSRIAKKGGQTTMNPLQLQSPIIREPPTYQPKNPTIRVEPAPKFTQSMFPQEFAEKIKEIQQYVAMDKAANEPNQTSKYFHDSIQPIKYTYNVMKSQRGGVILREQQDNPDMDDLEEKQKNAFSYFLNNSTMTLFSAKTRGVCCMN